MIYEYFMVFLGAAIPWMEIALVIPLGVVWGLSPFWVMVLAFVGNLLTVSIGLWTLIFGLSTALGFDLFTS